MADILGLVLPFFGMIFIGALAARIVGLPIEALGWMNVFVIYIALPALFFVLLSRTPIEELTEWCYIAGSLLATFIVFCLMFAGSLIVSRGEIAESTIKGLAAAYGNIGYMGPGLALLVFGPEAAVPVALIFSFENIMHFTIAPLMMAVAGSEKSAGLALALGVIKRIVLHPFILATLAGGFAAWMQVEPPAPVSRLLDYLAQAAAPCALFAMGVTLALRPLKRVPRELGAISMLKLVVHPILCWVILSLFGNFSDIWVYSAIMLAALPTATNVFVIAQQYDVWVQRASASVLVNTVLSVVTLTVILYLIVNRIMPADLFP
ncbi:MAG: AEC family transporter [Aquamicrobium sp.]|uniref:AEC family transporter n=1 Tax=Aquamicrobium sp. TaxID=1872579 RepID=UPI00349EF94E|nr:AEC family transporter [Aquamicrobium sp.]